MTSASSASRLKYSDVHHFKIPKRTEGDGMEENDVKLNNTTISEGKSLLEPSSKPLPGNIVYLLPKKQIKNSNLPFNITYRKEPKFVPYEPYKAAVKPILPHHKYHVNHKKEFKGKSNDISNKMPLISNLSVTQNENSDIRIAVPWEQEKQALQIELSRLKGENYELEKQLKLQAQVNAELKKLLVAAVGEDIEVRVQLLTEDKLHLATQLLNSAKRLSTHQEQIEWLAGQCEVWRSKFLASSCLVEDLAKWKAGLCQKVTECKGAMKGLLEETNKMKTDIINTNCKLMILRENFNLNGEYNKNDEEKAQNIVYMCSDNLRLANRLTTQLLGEVQNCDNDFDTIGAGDFVTDIEIYAQQLINQPMISLEHTDLACRAVMLGASIALSSSSPHCAHCNGTIKML